MEIPTETILTDSMLILIPFIYIIAGKNSIKTKAFIETAKDLGLYAKGIREDFKRTAILLSKIAIASILISGIFIFFGANDLEKVGNIITGIQEKTPLLLAYLLVFRVIGEEIFFRGFLTKKIGALFSTAIFALLHLAYGSIVEVLGAFILGYILAKEFEKNQNLLPNIFAHFFYNLAAIILLWL